jgi:hypothetical protein
LFCTGNLFSKHPRKNDHLLSITCPATHEKEAVLVLSVGVFKTAVEEGGESDRFPQPFPRKLCKTIVKKNLLLRKL